MFFIVKNHWEPSFTDNPRIWRNLGNPRDTSVIIAGVLVDLPQVQ
jgi:hypothetical protein